MSDVKTQDKRVRSWATVVYPESAPDAWMEVLGEQCIPVMISPLHDADVNPTGEPKKPHYHVLFNFDGKKSKAQVSEYISLIGGVGLEPVGSTRGYARYLCHLDNPEKAQYKPQDVKCYGGADYMGIIGLAIDKYVAIGEMIDFCDETHIYSYASLLRYARSDRMDWFRVLCDNGTVVIKEFLKSKSWESQQI
nr:unnamed protein product [uncultured bacterium]